MKYDPSRLVNCASGGNDFPVRPYQRLASLSGADDSGARIEAGRGAWRIRRPGAAAGRAHLASRRTTGAIARSTEGGAERGVRSAHSPPAAADRQGAVSSRLYADDRCRSRSQRLHDLRPRSDQARSAAKTAALHKKLFQPPPKEVVIVPTSREKAQTWRYTTEKPAEGWEKAGFRRRLVERRTGRLWRAVDARQQGRHELEDARHLAAAHDRVCPRASSMAWRSTFITMKTPRFISTACKSRR